MTGILSQLRTVAQTLNDLQVEWALVGALAVSIRTEPRTTRDIDVAVALSSKEEEVALLDSLKARGFQDSTVLMHVLPAHKLGMRVSVPTSGGSPVALDLLLSSSGIEAEIVAGAEPVEVFPGLSMPIASVGHLLAMKTLSQNDTDRIRDRQDLQRLFQVASEQDIRTAKEALSLIEQRGFGRGVDLQSVFLGLSSRDS